MNYEEFATYKPIKPALTNFARGYELTTGEQFYVDGFTLSSQELKNVFRNELKIWST